MRATLLGLVAALSVIPPARAQLLSAVPEDSILGRAILRDDTGGILAWYRPDVPGAAYDHIVRLASEFILTGTPIDPDIGKPLYYLSCCFDGPHLTGEEAFRAGKTWGDWPHNPACVFAGLVQGLVLDYYAYSGDRRAVDVVRDMLDFQIAHGSTPPDWLWASVPYASADPGVLVYEGATRWVDDGLRGDGLHVIEPDKVGELGLGYLNFYKATGEERFLAAALAGADALATHVRDVRPTDYPFEETPIGLSPWPFRVHARTGEVVDAYTSNVIEPIRLFDALLALGDRLSLSADRRNAYERVRTIAWDWLLSKSGPLRTGVWNGYFEDVPQDPQLANRVQITPMETARYLIKQADRFPEALRHVPALLSYVEASFGEPGLDAIREQTWCDVAMGSHTARFASIHALWHERTGSAESKRKAYRHFNVASYMTLDNGVVAVGPTWPGSWFSDGYGDYIRHFMEGMAAIPEWAPADEDHLLRTTSVIRSVSYGETEITYAAFDPFGRETLRLRKRPLAVELDGRRLLEESEGTDGWTWQSLDAGGVLRVRRTAGSTVTIRTG